jgi:SCP-2 sterol transfer family
MAEQQAVPESVTPEQFFEQLLPAGYAAQKAEGGAVPQDFSMQYHVTGAGGGDWHVEIKDGVMTSRKGTGDAVLTFTLAINDFLDAVLGRNGAAPALLLPASRPGRPDNSGRAKALKGTIAQELSREGGDPFKLEMSFNGAATPRTILKMKLADFVAMQEGKLNGQEAFMTGRLRVEGDMAFMMQVAALTA